MPLRIVACLVSLVFFARAPEQLKDLDSKAQEKKLTRSARPN